MHTNVGQKLIETETMKTGSVGAHIYTSVAKCIGTGASLMMLACFACAQVRMHVWVCGYVCVICMYVDVSTLWRVGNFCVCSGNNCMCMRVYVGVYVGVYTCMW